MLGCSQWHVILPRLWVDASTRGVLVFLFLGAQRFASEGGVSGSRLRRVHAGWSGGTLARVTEHQGRCSGLRVWEGGTFTLSHSDAHDLRVLQAFTGSGAAAQALHTASESTP